MNRGSGGSGGGERVPQPENKPPTLRHRRLVIGANVLVQIVAVLALVVMANWLTSRHYLRFDWTKSGYYKLCREDQADGRAA